MTNNFRQLFGGKINILGQSFKKWNIVFFVLYLVQGCTILLLSATHTFPITISFLTADSLQAQLTHQSALAPALHQLFAINLTYLVAAFLLVAAVMRLLAATAYKERYEADLKKGVGYIRWVECGLTGGVMLVTIGVLVGVYDVGSLLMIFMLVMIASLLGLVMEVHNPLAKRKQKPECLSGSVGLIAASIPWLIIALYVLAANIFGNGHTPTFIYWMYASVLIVFIGLAFSQYLHYTNKGQWADYLYGERWYMILSLVAKSLLAWQVFASVLRP
jgi:hypothetical protein